MDEQLIRSLDLAIAAYWDSLEDGDFVHHLLTAMELLADTGHAPLCMERLQFHRASVAVRGSRLVKHDSQ